MLWCVSSNQQIYSLSEFIALMSSNIERETNKQTRTRLHRIISITVCVLCLLYTYYSTNLEHTANLLQYLIVPLALIWFGDWLGSLTGIRFGAIGPVVNKTSPGSIVCLLGWYFFVVALWKLM